jgi:DNA-binding transcriptional LysR family regulator
MRFDLVDLQLFIAVADARSITHGASRAHLALASASARIKGLEAGLGVALLKRGRRGIELTAAGESLLDHARIIIHNVDTMRGDLVAFSRGMKATVRLLANTSGLSEYLPKALASFLAQHPHLSIDVEERESTEIAQAIATGAADLGLAAEHALPDSIERIPFSEDRLVLVVAIHDELAKRRQVDFHDVVGCDFIGLTSASALQGHIAGHAARLGARLRYRARLNNFDAMGQMVAAGIGIAVMPEVAAKRCARSMRISRLRIRDPWANRKLAICARSFRALPRPAQQLVEHLRKAAR